MQVGTQNRSGPPFQEARELIRRGKLGRIVCVSNNNSRNVMPGFGSPPDQAPPPGLDYDMFLGPAPSGPTIPIAPSIIFAGSGITPAGRRPTWASIRWTWCIGSWG